MTTVPQRKPNTPLNELFSSGIYTKPVPMRSFVERKAEPDLSARIS